MPMAQVNGAALNYMRLACKGAHSRGTLVMLHGLAANMGFWLQDYAPRFSQDFDVVLYDMRGHGRSRATKDGYTPDYLAADLEAFLDHLGIESAHILAHSFGGAAALKFACRHPARVQSLVLLDTHIGLGRKRAKEAGWETGQAVQKALDSCGIALDARDPYFGLKIMTEVARFPCSGRDIPETLKPWVRYMLNENSKSASEKWLSLMEGTKAMEELTESDGLDETALRRITCPVLAMYGEKSQGMASGQVLSSFWPLARFVTIADAGHFFPKTQPEFVSSTCKSFWADLPHEEGE